jgi:NADPH-dependent curcumin reductase
VAAGFARGQHLLDVQNREAAMPQPNIVNRRIILSSRPSGAPTPQNFRSDEQPVRSRSDGELLLQTLYLSLDPYMRGRVSDAPSYAPPVALGDVMIGGTVSRVVDSKNANFKQDDLVLGFSGWQQYEVSDGKALTKLDVGMQHPSLALGVLGMPGFTAYMGLLDIGQPKATDTVVVAAASGAVGAVVGQIAKLKGSRVVGIAGGAEKCRYVVEELRFDACLDHKSSDLAAQLAAACPKGIDVYFESVGGAVFDAVMPLLNAQARIPVCGLIAGYNNASPPTGPDRLSELVGRVLRKRIKMQGFIIFDDYGSRFGEFSKQMSAWVNDGKIKYREDIVNGLDRAPQAFIGLPKGKNFGKLVVKVADV